MSKAMLNSRLRSAAGFVRQGATFADIGTDHAYLPIFLLGEGKISRAILTDINEGPLESARRNVCDAGYSDRVELYLTDGAAQLSGLGIADFAICGMGGELIADIIERAPFLRDENINLILQPMSRQAHLRTYLASRGFAILDESYSYDAEKYYVTVLASFRANVSEISQTEAEIGIEKTRPDEIAARVGYLYRRASALARAVAGKGDRADVERTVLSAVLSKLCELGEQPDREKYIR